MIIGEKHKTWKCESNYVDSHFHFSTEPGGCQLFQVLEQELGFEFAHFLLRALNLRSPISKTPVHISVNYFMFYFGMALKNMWKPFFLSVTRSLLGELLEKLVEKLFCGGRDGVSAESSIALSERQSSKMEVNKLNKKNGKGTEKRRIRKCKIPTKSSDARNWKESRRRRRKKERKKFCERKVPPGTGSTDSSWCWGRGG